METPHRRVFFEEKEFTGAWRSRINAREWLVRRTRPRPEALTEAAHYVGGALYREGFRLFQNGGIPLLSRTSGELIEEIVIRPDARSIGLPYVRAVVNLHLSHSRLAAVRRRYWRPGGHAPHVVAAGNLGQLELPPCWIIWHLGSDATVHEELIEWVERLAVPWFNGFHQAIELHGKLLDGCVPLVRTDTALELMLAHYGAVEASLFLERSLKDHQNLNEAVRAEIARIRDNRVSPGFDNDVVHNLAVVAASFRLLGG